MPEEASQDTAKNAAEEPATGTPEPADTSASADAAAGESDATDATHAEDTLDTLREALSLRDAELAEAKDQALRARAEAENTRRRASRETENARRYALERFISDLLPAIDSFERGVEAASAAEVEESVVQGIELSLKLLLGALENAGVRVVDPVGEPFDPEFHEAMTVVAEPDLEPGSVARVIQKGYVLNDRLVRAAMVMVAQAPPVQDGDTGSEVDSTQG